ncbi:NADH-quinone oxidoreductase subunit J family protein [Hydrogenimonas sp.]
MLDVLFVVLSFFLVAGSLMALLGRDPAVYATGFGAVMLSLAGLFGLLEQSFLFLAQLMVGVGAVVVVTLIVVMTVNLKEENLPPERRPWLGALGVGVVVAPLAWVLYRALCAVAESFPEASKDFGSIQETGRALFSAWVVPFEILSLLLLAAMVGALVIGRKEQAYDIKS